MSSHLRRLLLSLRTVPKSSSTVARMIRPRIAAIPPEISTTTMNGGLNQGRKVAKADLDRIAAVKAPAPRKATSCAVRQ